MPVSDKDLKIELITYAHKVLERGDSWRAVRGYLNHKTEDDALKSEVIQALNALERNGHLETPYEIYSQKWTTVNTILGFVFVGLGILLFIVLWRRGWIAGFPVVIFAAGLKLLQGRF